MYNIVIPNIHYKIRYKLSFEKERSEKLSLLDVEVFRKENNFSTTFF